MSDTMTAVLAQLITQAPLLLVYLAGMVASLVFWQRLRSTSALTLIGTTALLVVIPVQTYITQSLIQARAAQGWSAADLGRFLTVVGLTGGLVRAMATALILSAVFVGRQTAPGRERASSGLFVGFMAGGLFLGLVFAALAGLDLVQNPGGLQAPGLLIASLLAMLWAEVVFVVLLYKAWACIQDGATRTSPGKAVGFLFIPFFNWYWIFRALPGFVDEYNSFIGRRNAFAPRLNKGAFQALAVFSLLTVIPILGLLAGLVTLVMQCVVAAKLCAAINALSIRSASGALQTDEAQLSVASL